MGFRKHSREEMNKRSEALKRVKQLDDLEDGMFPRRRGGKRTAEIQGGG